MYSYQLSMDSFSNLKVCIYSFLQLEILDYKIIAYIFMAIC